jgi:hypothetical protein
VLLTEKADALWITSWPFAEYVKHAWAGAWVCSCFRNESVHLSSELITEAVAATIYRYGPAPDLGMITFVNPKKVNPIKVRGKTEWGFCYKKAGFREVGATKGGLVALQILPDEMPAARPAIGVLVQLPLFGEAA